MAVKFLTWDDIRSGAYPYWRQDGGVILVAITASPIPQSKCSIVVMALSDYLRWFPNSGRMCQGLPIRDSRYTFGWRRVSLPSLPPVVLADMREALADACDRFARGE